jgi:hypothetical protein
MNYKKTNLNSLEQYGNKTKHYPKYLSIKTAKEIP